MQRNSQNKWAELTQTILGRTDNCIKNYWNCIFKNKQEQMKEKLTMYMKACVKLDQPKDEASYKSELSKRLLKHLVLRNQRAYIEHLRQKIN